MDVTTGDLSGNSTNIPSYVYNTYTTFDGTPLRTPSTDLSGNINPCYIIYGFLCEEIVTGLINCYSNISDKIVSTYKGYDSSLFQRLNDNGFTVLLNDLEIYSDPTNAEINQNRTGVQKATELGYTHTIHMNAELAVNDAILLRDTIKPLIETKMSSLAWFVDTNQYILNYLISGPVTELSIFYGSDKDVNDPRYVQEFTQEIYFNKNDLTFEDTTDKFNYSIQQLKDNSIEITWIRYPISEYPQYPEIINFFYYIKDNYQNLDIKY